VSSHLSSDIKITGDLTCSTDLIFDGSIVGNINCKGSLTVGKNATVEGDIKAANALIEGTVKGNGLFQRCRIAATAKVEGALASQTVQMDEGASLSGECKMGKSVSF